MVWYIIAGLIVFAGFTAFTGAPYVPSKPREVKRAFTKLYKLSAKDVVVDIGSGDGLVLRGTDGGNAGTGYFAVKMNGTGTAKAHAATEFRPGITGDIPDCPEQRHAVLGLHIMFFLVDHQSGHGSLLSSIMPG